ncbi:hypothetical protein PTKIN_Ptkin06aG0114300 [Pterospermum kingtungense]
MGRNRVRWGYDNCFVVDCVGRAGGLALLWNSNYQINLQTYSKYHIDVSVISKASGHSWRFTGFYGEPDQIKRHFSWDLLCQLSSASSLPWLIAGDFNEILSDVEKKGGCLRNANQMGAFHVAITDYSIEHHLVISSSDHIPILIKLFAEWNKHYRQERAFKFENMWLRDRGCANVIKNA